MTDKKSKLENEVDMLEVLTRVIRRSLHYNSVRRITENFGEWFSGLNADKLPEYKEAINAIKRYEDVLIRRLEEYSKEE